MDPLRYNYLAVANLNVTDALLLVALLLLIVCSAFFSAAETAFSTSNSIRLRNFAEDRIKGARRALYIVEHYDRTLSTILVGNNLVNIASTTICAVILGKLIANITLANVLNTVVMTTIILIFGEITPKSFAKINPEKFAMRYSAVLYSIILLLTPIVWPFYKMQKAFTKKAKIEETPTVTEEELESIIDTMEEEGVINGDNADIIQNAIKISDVTAYDIMTPRVDMVCASIQEDIAIIENMFFENNYSRLPIFEQTRDNIVGILNQKDFFAALLQNKEVVVSQLMKKPLFVPENMKVDELIKTMQINKFHIAVVLDEHGGTSGIATMEDCLESMVGEIYDEHDTDEEEQLIQKIDENTYVLDADIQLDDLFKTLEIEHLPKTEYSSLSGFLFEVSESLVEEGSEIMFKTVDDTIDKEGMLISKPIDMKFTIIKMEQNRVKQVKLEIL